VLRTAWADGSGNQERFKVRAKFLGRSKLSTRAQITSFGRKTRAPSFLLHLASTRSILASTPQRLRTSNFTSTEKLRLLSPTKSRGPATQLAMWLGWLQWTSSLCQLGLGCRYFSRAASQRKDSCV
jgi:hypothetical protein